MVGVGGSAALRRFFRRSGSGRSSVQVTVHTRSRLARMLTLANATNTITLGCHIYTELDRLPPWLLNHELIHVCQQHEQGFLRFGWRYLVSGKSYRDKPAEREAYAHQFDPHYRARKWPGLTINVRYA